MGKNKLLEASFIMLAVIAGMALLALVFASEQRGSRLISYGWPILVLAFCVVRGSQFISGIRKRARAKNGTIRIPVRFISSGFSGAIGWLPPFLFKITVEGTAGGRPIQFTDNKLWFDPKWKYSDLPEMAKTEIFIRLNPHDIGTFWLEGIDQFTIPGKFREQLRINRLIRSRKK